MKKSIEFVFFRLIWRLKRSSWQENHSAISRAFEFQLRGAEKKRVVEIPLGKPPEIYASTKAYIKKLAMYTWYPPYLPNPIPSPTHVPMLPCLIPSPQCHWILKNWRHLDCSTRIIFRFQLIYHCRARERRKLFHIHRYFCLKKDVREKKGRKSDSELQLTRRTFWYFLKCHNCIHFTDN